MDEQALSAMKILDVTQFIAGPFCTKLLADYGADVIKVEKPGCGDMSRRMGPFPDDIPDHEESGLFLYLNTNKKGITLNLKTQDGRDIFKELVKRSDILVENFMPGVMARLGLDYTTLKDINPRLVMTSISNFGQTGPYRDCKATEITLFALSARMYKTGDPDREPLKYALNAYQYYAGLQASCPTLAYAMGSKMTGKGRYIDVSILETILADHENQITWWSFAKAKGFRLNAKNLPVYPWGAFPTKDGYISIQGVGRGEAWMPRLYGMMGMPELAEDPRFSTPQERLKHSDEFNALLYSWLIDHTKQEVFDAADKYRYPMAPVYTTEELMHSPHHRERGFFIEIDHPRAGKLEYPGAAFIMSQDGFSIRRPAPLLGEHNADVYCGLLGYSKGDLAVLRRLKII